MVLPKRINIAASKAKGEWLVMLNPDAVADESWLEKNQRWD